MCILHCQIQRRRIDIWNACGSNFYFCQIYRWEYLSTFSLLHTEFMAPLGWLVTGSITPKFLSATQLMGFSWNFPNRYFIDNMYNPNHSLPACKDDLYCINVSLDSFDILISQYIGFWLKISSYKGTVPGIVLVF